MRKKGFTLIELMIVVAIIAIVAAIAIPGLLRARISANEGSAIGSLRTISTSQTQFQSNRVVDQDTDGVGEFGVLAELAGVSAVRAADGAGSRVKPGFIPTILGDSAANGSTKSGYKFRIYLPGGIIDDANAPNALSALDPSSADTEIDAQETHFRAYAWPFTVENTGNRAFSVDQAGEVFATTNVNRQAYSGSATPPEFNAAADTEEADSLNEFQAPIRKTTGFDNQSWVPAGG